MIKKCLLFFYCLFLIIDTDEVFAFPKEYCQESLLALDKDDQRFRELSPQAQNMMQIASLIAQVTHTNTLPAKVNLYHILLAALTEVQLTDEAIHHLNLVDIDSENKNVLFVVLKNLEILRDFQRFLLEKIGLNSSDPDPFQFQSDGSLLLHLNGIVPTIIDYDQRIDRLWNLAIREKEKEIRYTNNKNKSNRRNTRYNETFWNLTFPEHFFLAALSVDLPLLHFLSSEHFNSKTLVQIKDTFYHLIDQAKQSYWNFSKKRHNSYSEKEKTEAVDLVIKRGEKIGITKAIAEVAEQKSIFFNSLSRWVYKYKKEHNLPLSKGPKTYSKEEKTEAIDLAIKRGKEIGVTRALVEVAEQKNMPFSTLNRWVSKYKKEHNLSRRQTYNYSEERLGAVDLIIEREIGVKEAIEELAEQKNIPFNTLDPLFWEYHEE